jgi:hypothetical protein
MKLIMRRSTLLAATLITALATAGCDSLFGPGDNTLLRDQLTRGEQLWRQANITSYSMVVERGPLHAEGYRAVVVHVRNGQVTDVRYADDDTPVGPAERAEHRTVTGLFEIVRDALDRRAPGLFVRYDDELGFPSTIQVDYDPTRLGDELHIGVSELTPLP